MKNKKIGDYVLKKRVLYVIRIALYGRDAMSRIDFLAKLLVHETIIYSYNVTSMAYRVGRCHMVHCYYLNVYTYNSRNLTVKTLSVRASNNNDICYI